MWRRLALGLAAAASLLVLLGSTVALAAGPDATGPIQMLGNAVISQSQRQTSLVITADATDGSGWHLDVVLQPTRPGRGDEGSGEDGERGERGERSQGAGSQTIGLAGQFELSAPGLSPIGGQATGRISSQGVGTLQFVDQNGSAQLDAAFSTDANGQVQLELSGQLPALATPSASAPTDSTATSGNAVTPAASAGNTVAPTTAPAQADSHIFWYIARAAGMSAYVVLFVNIVLGLAVSTKFMDDIVARWQSFDLHQFTALLSLGLLGVHVLALLGDHYIGFTVGQLLVPFESTYRPTAIAMGIVGFYALLVITASFYVKRVIGQKAWRAIHYVSFGAYVLALAHGIFSGTDSSTWWAQMLYWGTGLTAAVLTIWRFSRSGGKPAMATAARRPVGAAVRSERQSEAGVGAARR